MRPGTIWTHETSLALGPNESKQIALPASLIANPGDMIFATSESAKDAVMLLQVPREVAD
jgi:hypothetical protein